MVHVAVNKYAFEKINILEYAFGEGGGGYQKAYAVYAFVNVDNCERPLSIQEPCMGQSDLRLWNLNAGRRHSGGNCNEVPSTDFDPLTLSYRDHKTNVWQTINNEAGPQQTYKM